MAFCAFLLISSANGVIAIMLTIHISEKTVSLSDLTCPIVAFIVSQKVAFSYKLCLTAVPGEKNEIRKPVTDARNAGIE